MKLTGTWASYWNDLQLKFTEDGTMALTSLEEGIFDQPTEYTLTDSGFSFPYAGSTVSLTRKDDDTFTGKDIELIRLRTVLPVYATRTFDRSGNPVSLPALRQHLIDGTAIHPNDRAGYNGGTFHLEEYREYMAKNTLRFSKGIVNQDGTDESPQIMLSPADYPIEKTEPSDQALILHDPDAFWA